MSTLMQSAALWLGQRLNDAAGREITLRRRGMDSELIVGSMSFSDYQEIGTDGLTTSVRYADWIFTATDVIHLGSQVTPRDGDLISEELNGATVRYEVMPTQSRPSVEWFDSSGELIVVHTKRVE